MKVKYIEHSGFLVELKTVYLIFDYYKGSLGQLDSDKMVYVFCSHRHGDHYNPEVFAMLENSGISRDHILAVLAYDIPAKKYPQIDHIMKVKSGESYKLTDEITVSTLKSTDQGVAFIVYTTEGMIYHAGDLNDWAWEGETKAYNNSMAAFYNREIDKIKDKHFKLAFVPMDPRLEKNYAKGILYFLKRVSVDVVFPMHMWNDEDILNRFHREHPEYPNVVKNMKRGQTYEI